jgi:RNA polymerase sigma-70 factor (ECF subfamily)
LPAWARRIAFRVCLNEWRRRKSRPERLWTDLSEEQAALLEGTRDTFTNAHAEATAARELVNLLLEQLPPEERWVIELADLEERSLEEITELTGWSALNIRVRRFRARRTLRRALKQLEIPDSHEK